MFFNSNSKGKTVFTCVECGKTFLLPKALYGHMRCHPDKGYRGVNPPPELMKKIQRCADPAAQQRAMPAPRRQRATPKRDQLIVSVKSCSESSVDNSTREAIIAATIILDICRGSCVSPVADQEVDTLPRRRRTRAIDNEEDTIEEEVMDVSYSENIRSSAEDVERSSHQSSLDKNEKRKKIRVLRSVCEESPQMGGKRYQCRKCNRSFSTHHALGGHRASHNKYKNTAEEVIVVDEAEQAGPSHDDEFVDHFSKGPAAEHRCRICNLTFPSGQALGGHMRKHWIGPENLAAPSPAASPESSTKPDNVFRDFNLNEPPKPESQ
ncbi:zinc finger protein ZAT2-like [Typha angustifolia]|uniref:zinc finger protein ZAT2-like n=1 Tax=Typha angustifolia TaxID=59011 RepID=UPI003C308CDF